MSDLKKRVLTGIIGIILIVIVLYSGSNAIKISLFVLSLECINELTRAFKKCDVKINTPSLIIGAALTAFISFKNYNLLIAPLIFIILASTVAVFSESNDLKPFMYTVFSYVYGVFLINLLGNIKDVYLIILAFVISFSTDTFAFFVGSLIGRHKLIERVSPKKTIEGAIGGTFFSIMISVLYLKYINKYFLPVEIDLLAVLTLALASLFGQIGDLFASKIKRYTGIKDFANLLPGHGGILDRFDSLAFVTVFVYILSIKF